MRSQGGTGYLLHSVAYRESSLLADIFTLEEGRLRCIAKGFRKPGRSGLAKSLNPYTEYKFNWTGRGELKTLTAADALQSSVLLQGDALYTGLYLNELLYRLLHEQEPHPAVYGEYKNQLVRLSLGVIEEAALRLFEITLLEELGYGLVLDREASTGATLDGGLFYRYLPEEGLQPVPEHRDLLCWRGADLLAVAERNFSSEQARRAAKQLLRQVLDFYLGGKPLHSRELFRSHRRSGTVSW